MQPVQLIRTGETLVLHQTARRSRTASFSRRNSFSNRKAALSGEQATAHYLRALHGIVEQQASEVHAAGRGDRGDELTQFTNLHTRRTSFASRDSP